MTIISCPDAACQAPAEVTDRWCWSSTDGPIEHLRTRCLRGHTFTVPVEPLGLEDALDRILGAA
jgi:hypothetical protein